MKWKVLLMLSAPLAIAACEKVPNPPLIFGQSHILGVNVSGTTTTQGLDMTLGYKDFDLAIVPVTVTQGDKTVTKLDATVKGTDGSEASDAFSVLGQFEATASGTQIGLGKFFATGTAAQKLADGFKNKLSK